jgi:hypothetical protein
MGLFDGVSKKEEITIGGDFFKLNTAIPTPTNVISEDVTQKRVDLLKKRTDSLITIEETQKTIEEGRLFPNTQKVHPLSTVIHEKAQSVSKREFDVSIYRARIAFEDELADRLFMSAVGTIILEACPIDNDIKQKEEIRTYVTEMAYDIFRNTKSYAIAQEQALPNFLREIFEEAIDCARVEGTIRFDPERISSECGFNAEKLRTFVDNELQNITLLDDKLNSHFPQYAAMVITENEDVIAHIKEKVTGELNSYKKAAEKLASAKQEITDKVDEGDPLNKDDTGDNPGGDDDDGAGKDNAATGGGENPENKGTDAEGPGTETKAAEGSEEGSSGGESDDSSGDDGSTGEGETEPEKTGSGETGTDGNAGENSSGEEGEGSGKTKTEGENPGDSETVTTPPSLSITEEIEDAASFASANSHTFNTGDEKFGSIHKKISTQLIDAVNSGNVDSLVKLKSQAKSAADKLRSISDTSNKKYADTLDKLDNLSNNISFEINKMIQNKVTTTESTMSIFGKLILNIGTRFKEKIAAESGISTEDAVQYIPGDQVLNEVLIYQTTFESLNTLRLLDFSNKDTYNAFKQFLDTVKVA